MDQCNVYTKMEDCRAAEKEATRREGGNWSTWRDNDKKLGFC